MASTPEAALPLAGVSEEEQVYIASQWKLIRMRFLRHRLAVISAGVIMAFYLIAIFAEFFSIHDPQEQLAKNSYIPPQRVHFFEGFKPTRPYVYGLIGERNQVSRAMEWKADESQRFNIQFFVRGHEYKLVGLFTTNLHMMGLDMDTIEGSMPFYPMGTDRMGRDQFSRLMYGTRISMSIGLIGVVLNVFLWVLLGGLSGLRGGFTDLIIQRFIEFLRAIPTIPLWLGLAASVPRDWSVVKMYFAITIIISLISWTRLAREVRGRFLVMREEDFVLAARLYGTSELRLIFRHMLPSFLSHIIATTTLAVPAIIVAETSLSFLGLGLRAPAISWGVLLFEAQNLQAIAKAAWLMFPAVFVLISILAFNFVGDGLRDAADPYAVRS